MTRARALHTFPWVQAVFRPGARPRRVETGVRCRDCRDLRSPGIEAAGARRGLNVDQGRCRLLGDEAAGARRGPDVEGVGSPVARRRGAVGTLSGSTSTRVVGGCSTSTRNAGGSSRVVGTLQPLDVDEGGGARRLLGVAEDGGARRGGSSAQGRWGRCSRSTLVEGGGSSARRRRGNAGPLVGGGRGSPTRRRSSRVARRRGW